MSATSSFPPEYLNANHNAEIIAVCILFMCLSTLAMVARFISKRMRKVALGIEDWILCVAWIIALANSVATAYSIRTFKLGYHVVTLNEAQLLAIPKSYFASNFVQSTTLFLSKISILIILWRVFFITPAFRIATYILGAIVILWWIANIISGIFICVPVRLNWDPTAKGVCGNLDVLEKTAAIPWIVTDFAILVYPLPVIKDLQLTKKKRIGLYLIFSLGALTCIVSAIRYSWLYRSKSDITWDMVTISLLNVIEANITVCCAALLACQPVFKYIFGSPFVSSLRSLFGSKSQSTSQISHDFGWTRHATEPGNTQSEENLRELPPLSMNGFLSKDISHQESVEIRNGNGWQNV